MATLFCKWPPAEKDSADAYNAECAVRYGRLTAEEGAVWSIVREDANGNWTAPLLGPPWFHATEGDFEEPASCLALRSGAVVVATPEWSQADE